jgi:hypothetical protein
MKWPEEGFGFGGVAVEERGDGGRVWEERESSGLL